jgi:tetratricopeptide (TPR) repeat protein
MDGQRRLVVTLATTITIPPGDLDFNSLIAAFRQFGELSIGRLFEVTLGAFEQRLGEEFIASQPGRFVWFGRPGSKPKEWALGVLLYELLAGRRPFTLAGRSRSEIDRIVQHEEAVLPSAVACTPEVARVLRGDLDRIVQKALRKEPERRYGSADDLAEDVDRWLGGLPVHATPDSFRYRLHKFVRRNRADLAVAATLSVLIVAFAATSAWQARRVAHERDNAVAERQDAEAAIAMLVDVFRVADPQTTPGGDTLRVKDLVRIAESRIESTRDHPRIEAKLWQTMAAIRGARSHYDEQRHALDRALADAERAGLTDELLSLSHERGRLLLRLDGPRAVEPLFRESLARHEARFRPNVADVAIACQDLSIVVEDEAERERLLERALQIRRSLMAGGADADSVGFAGLLNALGSFHWARGEWSAAQANFAEGLAILGRPLPRDHPNVLSMRSNLAVSLQVTGRFAEAERMHRALLESRRRILGEDSESVAGSLMNIGVSLVNEGPLDEGVESLRKSFALAQKIYGPQHTETLAIGRDLGLALVRSGRAQEGLALLDRARDAAAAGGSDLRVRGGRGRQPCRRRARDRAPRVPRFIADVRGPHPHAESRQIRATRACPLRPLGGRAGVPPGGPSRRGRGHPQRGRPTPAQVGDQPASQFCIRPLRAARRAGGRATADRSRGAGGSAACV